MKGSRVRENMVFAKNLIKIFLITKNKNMNEKLINQINQLANKHNLHDRERVYLILKCRAKELQAEQQVILDKMGEIVKEITSDGNPSQAFLEMDHAMKEETVLEKVRVFDVDKLN